MRRVPRSLVAGAGEELVRIVGRLEAAKEIVTAPISGRPCAAYSVSVEQRGAGVGPTSGSRELASESAQHDFVLDDGSARALVRIRHCQMLLTPWVLSGNLRALPERVRDFLDENRVSTRTAELLRRRLVVSEGALFEGDEVAVVGVGRWLSGEKEGDQSERLLLVEGSVTDPVLISNDRAVMRS
jgi:hypothetical protein